MALCHLSKWRVTWAPLLYLVQSPVLGAGGGKGEVLTRSLFQPCSLSFAVPFFLSSSGCGCVPSDAPRGRQPLFTFPRGDLQAALCQERH